MNRILIVEDEITISRLIAVSLRRAGYDCTVANDGSTAADLIAEHDFDLALLDIMLPGLDGYELLGYLRPLGVPVIFITAKGATKDRVRGLQLGADDYIVKPFEIEELLARVEAVLRRTGRGGQTLTAFDVTMDIVARTVTRQGGGADPAGVRPAGAAHAQPRGGAVPRCIVRAGVGRRSAGQPHPGPAHPAPAQKTWLGG